jgi:CheY-like chemotaxis protein
VIITDHHMPGINGLELVTHIRTGTFDGKIIVFSSELSQAVDDAYRRLKVDHILPKPIFPAQLRAVFATL